MAHDDLLQDSDVVQREQWTDHVRQERLRIRKLAIERRLGILKDSNPGVLKRELDAQRSLRALHDQTLQRGDIVVTGKGTFVFKGQGSAERSMGDFDRITD